MVLAEILVGKRWRDVLSDVRFEYRYKEMSEGNQTLIDVAVRFALDLKIPVKEIFQPRRSRCSHQIMCAALILDYIGFDVVIAVTTPQEKDEMERWLRTESNRPILVAVIGQPFVSCPPSWLRWLLVYLALPLNCASGVLEALALPLRYCTRVVLVDDYHGESNGVKSLMKGNRVFFAGSYSLHTWTPL
jgi:hypothetical protein